MMKCKRCRQTAVVALPAHNAGFCPQCFLMFFERQVQKAVKDHEMFSTRDRILVALSGGKDSLALAHELKKQGFDISGLHIDLAIPGSSPEARDHVESFCRKNSIELFVLEMEEEGLPIPLVRERIKRPVCSMCGKIKRYFFNKFAADRGFTVLATGHNLDDETARLLSNILNWDQAHLGDQGPFLPHDQGFVRKIKPLYRVGEFVTANYCFISGIDYSFAPCPYSRGASFTFYKTLLDDLEFKQPGRKLSFYQGFLSRGQKGFALQDMQHGVRPSPCSLCSYPTSRGVCGVCRARAMMRHQQTVM